MRRVGHRVDALEHAAADKESADEPEHDDDRERPAPGIGDDAVEALALLEVAPDQQAEAAGQFHHLHQRAMLDVVGLFDAAIGGFEPTRMVEHARLERADIAGKPLPVRRGDQIEVRSRPARAQIDKQHEPPDTGLGVLVAQAHDFAGDHAGDLFVDQAARIEREVAEQRSRKHHKNKKIDERQLERRRAQQFSERGHRSGLAGIAAVARARKKAELPRSPMSSTGSGIRRKRFPVDKK